MASGIQDSAHASLPDPDSKCSGSSKWVFHWKAPTPQQLRILMEENLHCPAWRDGRSRQVLQTAAGAQWSLPAVLGAGLKAADPLYF